jgi:hypothetical protein
MKPSCVVSCAILLASAAFAAPPDVRPDDPVAAAVQREFLAPLARRNANQKEFSRADPPATATRVRVLGEPQRDAEGAEFVRFAVDTRRFAPEWSEAEYTGCVYTASSAVYVKRGELFRPAATYFARKTVKPNAAACSAGRS